LYRWEPAAAQRPAVIRWIPDEWLDEQI